MTLYNLVVSQNTKYWYSRSLEAVTNQVQYTLTTLSLNRIRMPTDVMNDEMWKLFRGIPGNHSPLTHNPPTCRRPTPYCRKLRFQKINKAANHRKTSIGITSTSRQTYIGLTKDKH